jgi:serine O-acetyltransferase
MWSELAADARFYSALRWPGKQGPLKRALIWTRSRGLLVLALQRASHRYLVQRAQRGLSPGMIAWRMVLGLAQRPVAMLTKCDVADSIVIGRGTYLSDRGFLILGPERIGSGTLIHERVTIGVRAGGERRPSIGENVWIGPDCVIYGDVSFGDGATVLPGSVVSMNVPARAVAAGNPAVIVCREFDNSGLRSSLACDVDPKSLALRDERLPAGGAGRYTSVGERE